MIHHIHLLILRYGLVWIRGSKQLQLKKVKQHMHIKVIFKEHHLLENLFNLPQIIHLNKKTSLLLKRTAFATLYFDFTLN